MQEMMKDPARRAQFEAAQEALKRSL